MKKSILATGLFAVLLLVACNTKPDITYFYYEPDEYAVISQYLNLPELPPKYTAELPAHLSRTGLSPRTINTDEATLGRVLFYDKNLSSDKTVACANCHKQDKGFADDASVSKGVQERQGERNAFALSSVANFAAYYGTDLFGAGAVPFFWDNRAETAAQQAFAAMSNPKEMNMHESDIVAAVQAAPYYAPLFRKAFGDDKVSKDRITSAISNFVNAMGSYQSRFDAGANQTLNGTYGYPDVRADFVNFTQSENRGKTLYMNNCSSCHTENFGRPIRLLANNGLDATTVDPGVGGITGRTEERGSFKVPTLRNVALSAPYMHDGRFQTLEQVIDFYSTGVQSHPYLSQDLRDFGGQPKKMNFSAQDKQDLMAFLSTLTDDVFMHDERFSNPFK